MPLFSPFDTAALLSDCACAALKDSERGEDAYPESASCCVWPGDAAPSIDCCENGGQISVVAVSGVPTVSFPAPVSGPLQCGYHTWATTFEIKVTRCVPTGLGCDCECKETAAHRILGDVEALIKAITCCFSTSRDDCAQFVINTWRVLEAKGGCSGSALSVTVETDSPCCATT